MVVKLRKITNIGLESKPEVPNDKTAELLALSKKQIDNGEYYKFKDNDQSLDFLVNKISE